MPQENTSKCLLWHYEYISTFAISPLGATLDTSLATERYVTKFM